MNLTSHLDLLTHAEALTWLLLLLALYVGGGRREIQLKKSAIRSARVDEVPPDYRALAAFAVTRLFTSFLYAFLVERTAPFGLSGRQAFVLYYSLYWTLYLIGTVSVFFFMASLMKNSLKPVPGFSAAVTLVFRWASLLALVLALTAHIPVFGIRNVQLWMNEVSISFALCVCAFEVLLLGLLLTRLQKLGMCLRSRPVGFAIGLTVLGCIDLASAVTINAPAHYLLWEQTSGEVLTLLAIAGWIYYIILPEPLRNAHSLSPASPMLKWNEIALKLGLNGKQAESAPFISHVESVVASVLKKHNIGNF